MGPGSTWAPKQVISSSSSLPLPSTWNALIPSCPSHLQPFMGSLGNLICGIHVQGLDHEPLTGV